VRAVHHIQVEPLKVLKGSPMREIAKKEQYAFAAAPPYQILQTPWLAFEEIGRIETIARLLDLYHNSDKFNATLAVAAEALPLANFFDELARFWEGDELPPHLSREHLFTKLWQFCSSVLATPAAEKLRDALCYDYCLADYPAGELPSYFSGNRLRRESGKVAMPAVVRNLGIATGSRVRTFAWQFARDYRRQPLAEVEVELLFVYVSAPGKGLRVEVLTQYPPKTPALLVQAEGKSIR
jgi:anaerobic magnesium-protoporphyrin IX monomethyl ester cyclase